MGGCYGPHPAVLTRAHLTHSALHIGLLCAQQHQLHAQVRMHAQAQAQAQAQSKTRTHTHTNTQPPARTRLRADRRRAFPRGLVQPLVQLAALRTGRANAAIALIRNGCPRRHAVDPRARCLSLHSQSASRQRARVVALRLRACERTRPVIADCLASRAASCARSTASRASASSTSKSQLRCIEQR